MAFDKRYYLQEFDNIVKYYREAHIVYLEHKSDFPFDAFLDKEIHTLFEDFLEMEDYEMCKCMKDAWEMYKYFYYEITVIVYEDAH